MVNVDLRVVELLCARLCHELISPIGAISNGVEIMGEEEGEFLRDAIGLIGQSSRQAGKRLQFYRFAYGFTGVGTSAAIDVRDLIDGLVAQGKVSVEWRAEATTLPLDWQKLACNMLLLALEALPRGGAVVVRRRADGPGVEVMGSGEPVLLNPEVTAALLPGAPISDLSSRTVQAYFAARLADRIGADLSLALSPPQGFVVAAAAR